MLAEAWQDLEVDLLRLQALPCPEQRTRKISQRQESGQASLSVVGPGIAEALVATAVGLLAAIPAMMAYNAFGGRIDGILAMLDRFSSQFQEDLDQLVQNKPIHPVMGSDVERVARVEEG